MELDERRASNTGETPGTAVTANVTGPYSRGSDLLERQIVLPVPPFALHPESRSGITEAAAT